MIRFRGGHDPAAYRDFPDQWARIARYRQDRSIAVFFAVVYKYCDEKRVGRGRGNLLPIKSR